MVLMATTEGLTLSTTATKSGNAGALFSTGGNVQLGSVGAVVWGGDEGGDGVGGGVGGGEVSI